MIVIDVGNTSLNFMWIDDKGKAFKIKRIPTLGVRAADIKEIFSKNKHENIIVCSVVPGITAMLKKIKKELAINLYIIGQNINPVRKLTPFRDLSLTGLTRGIRPRVRKIWENPVASHRVFSNGIKVPIKSFYNKRHIGMDRLVAAYAAKKIYKDARIVVDFGTAITFDILSKNGDYEGGLILPGLGSTLKVLSACALLPKKIKLRSVRMSIPRDTQDSINKGIEEGFALMINSLIEKYKKILKIKNNTKVIITGGDAKFILQRLKSPIIFDQFLVMRGLSLLAEKYLTPQNR